MIQTAVDAYYTKNNATFPVNETVKLTVTDPTAFTQSQFTSNGDDISSNEIILYEVDYKLIGIVSLKYGRKQEGTNDVYVLSKQSGKVYYAKGLKIGNNVYYTLTDDISNLLSYNSDKNTVNSPIVLFEPSENEWTSSDVTIKIKIPTTCETINSVKVINEDKTETILTSSTEENGYYIYQATPIGNYTVEVNYKLKASDTESKTAKYSVTNVDKTAPVINVDTSNKVKIKFNGYIGYIKVASKSDNLSGVKTIKYDFGDFINSYSQEAIKTHFEVAGEEVKDNVMFVKSGCDKITVYIEDNAGNFYAELIDTVDILKDAYPVIPNGFEHVEGTVEEGYVIKNTTDGNEFVWVPVEEETFVREESYSFGKPQEVTSYTEPYETTEYTAEREEYDKMVASVNKYGGFYMGRYEASNNGSGLAQSLQNQSPWFSISWGTSMTDTTSGAVEKARAVYPDSTTKTTGDAVSILPYAVQWDATVRFIETNYPGIATDSEGYGNFDPTTNAKINTGSNENYALKNIYDMAGNVWEWTMEAGSSNSRVYRGGYVGYLGDDYAISTRMDTLPSDALASIGFRLALYVK